MDGQLVEVMRLSPPWQTPKSIDVSSTDYASQDSQHTFLCCPNFATPRSYNFAFYVPLLWEKEEDEDEDNGEEKTHTKWFTISIRADGPGKVYTKEKPLTSFWDGKLRMLRGFTAIGSHVYAIGGRWFPNCQSDVCKLNVTYDGAYCLDPVCPMICPRFSSNNLVVDGKIYVLFGHQVYLSKLDLPPTTRWGEVFDPEIGQWEALPDPPYESEFTIFSVALDNSNKILVAFHVPRTSYSAMFYTYNMQDRSWEMLELAECKLHPKFPIGSLQRTVNLHNTLYWVTRRAEEVFLIAYILDLDMWLEESLMGLGISWSTNACLFHLQKQRFCLLQTSLRNMVTFTPHDNFPSDAELHYIVFDISHMLGEKRLGLSLAWEQKHKVDCPFALTNCLLP